MGKMQRVSPPNIITTNPSSITFETYQKKKKKKKQKKRKKTNKKKTVMFKN